jgi:hypothetical protein
VKIVPPTFDAKVMGMKPCSMSDVVHILKELEYTLPIILHPEEYYFIYCLQMCLLVGFTPPMLDAKILIEDFQHNGKI